MDKFNERKEIISVLGILRLAEKGLTASEIGAAADISDSHRRPLLEMLVEEGAIHQMETDLSAPTRYELTPEFKHGEAERKILKSYLAEMEGWLEERRSATSSEQTEVGSEQSEAVFIIDDEIDADFASSRGPAPEIFTGLTAKYQALSAEDDLKLARLARAGDRDARNRFALHHLQQIVQYARRHSKPGASADVVQKCLIDLMHDVQHMDLASTRKLTIGIFNSIRRSTINYEIDHGGIIRVTAYMRKLWRQIKVAKLTLSENFNTSPDITELVKRTGLTERQIVSALKWEKILDVMSLDDPMKIGVKAIEFLPASESSSPNLDKLENEERKKLLERILQKLKKRSRLVLILRFGLEDGQCHTQEEVGHLLPQRLKPEGDPDSGKSVKPLSKDAISHIERRALKTLKRQFGRDLQSFLEV